MTTKPQEITPLSIKELFDEKSHYIIPLYQRNYSWGEVEIEQLIQDIWDQCTINDGNKYYLGSLVVFERKKNDAQVMQFETIDGQQRHTTLSILLAVFKNTFKFALDSVEIVNLRFDSRTRSESTLHDLYKLGAQEDKFKEQEASMLDAYTIAEKYLFKLFNDESARAKQIQKLWDYFISKVIILRSPVPHDTDLNHYFEIMNNRGEQLEKHEVLKARLMGKKEKEEFSLDIDQQYTFGEIWDACADMDRYVQYGFSPNTRKAIFGGDLNNTKIIFNGVKGFDTVVAAFKKEKSKETKLDNIKESSNIEELSIADIFSNAEMGSSSKESDTEGDERFGSIINFPNFLLQTLKIMKVADQKGGTDYPDDVSCPLDDKRLLNAFTDSVDSKTFIMALLKTRYLFDKYIIKRERDKAWSLRRMIAYNKSKVNYINTFAKDMEEYSTSETDITNINHKIKMLLSMLHVSFPQMIYKNWLSGVLNYLVNENNTPASDKYLEFLENYNDRIFYGLFGEETQLSFYDINYTDKAAAHSFDKSELTKATHIQNYIFNRLDYALWRKTVVNREDLPIDKKRDMNNICRNFSFSLRSSVEHYYPQRPIDEQPELKSPDLTNGVDSFGNLCLLSSSKNSKLSNLMPKAKKDHYPPNATNIESLKQQVMMLYDDWDSAHASDINSHEQQMIDILK